MKWLILTILSTAALVAQTPMVVLSPYGTWQLCEDQPQFIGTPFCPTATVPTGTEPFVLLVTATRTDTTAFRWSLSGIGIDGKPHVYSGIFDRNDDPEHLIMASHVVVNCGRLTSVSVRIVELTVGAVWEPNVVVMK